MFTGIIQEMGSLETSRNITEGKEFVVKAPLLAARIKVDDSVAINGVCQTATAVNPPFITVQCVQVSLSKTNLGQLKKGDRVNLELALRPTDYIGGHFVQGHVNGKAKLTKIETHGKNKLLSFHIDQQWRPYIVQEGPITLEGVSLTVAALTSNTLTVSIIPHTNSQTTLDQKKVGDEVNLEVDVFAKYVESLLLHRFSPSTSSARTSPADQFLQSWLNE